MNSLRSLNLCGSAMAVACAVLLSFPTAKAQTSFASVTGTVVDTSGAAIAKAAIKVINRDTGVSVAASTDASGVYNIVSLIPGAYRILAEQTGFDTASIENVVLSATQTATVNITLRIGKASETITVSEETSLLNPTTAMQATTINKDIVTDLPYPP